MALLTALIGQTIKLRWKLSLQVRGDGPVRLIATDYYAPGEDGAPARIRAYASFDAERLSRSGRAVRRRSARAISRILIDQGDGTKPYQGITPIAGGSLSACAETYFAQSEQLPTRFALSFGKARQPGAAERWRAGGVMLQHMPKASPLRRPGGGSGEGGLMSAEDVLDGEEAENWDRANLLLDTVEETELIGPHVAADGPAGAAVPRGRAAGLRRPAGAFGCTCSAGEGAPEPVDLLAQGHRAR